MSADYALVSSIDFSEAKPKEISKVILRDNTIASYDFNKIVASILQALKVHGDSSVIKAFKYYKEVEKRISKKKVPEVEFIQDTIEDVLIDFGEKGPAKSFILYRQKRRECREEDSVHKVLDRTMSGYLQKLDWRVNENSNVGYSLGGLILHNSGAITANYWLNRIYNKDVADAHKNCSLHIHDLSMLSCYCSGWSLEQLIREGLGGVENKISSKPAVHLHTLINQIVNFLGVLQNEWAGAQAFSSFDTYLAPFVKTDNLNYKEVKQCIQSFIFGINTPSRWGSQSPFSNITLDWVVPNRMRKQPAIVGGIEQDFNYGDCQKEMDVINKSFLEVLLEGDSNGRGFAYPIPTYNITREFDWDHPNSELLFKMAGKFGTPYFQNFINSDLDPDDVRSMCCRLQLDKRELRKRGGGLFGSDAFTGSIGVVTLNLPQIGYKVRSKDAFFKEVGRLMEIAKDSLEVKRKTLKNLMDNNLFPYSKRYLKSFDNHFSTIGIVGMNEACLNLMGKDITESDSQEFALSVLKYMRNRLQTFQKETGNLYNLEATPAEGTSYRFAKYDKAHFPDILTSGQDSPYYTNSTQLPVGHTKDVFEAMNLQDKLQIQYTGGTVFHAMLGQEIPDTHTVKNLVRTMCSHYHMPYITLSPVYSICPTHGYLSGEHFECPECNEPSEVYARIVGYYRPVKNWNSGKKAEYEDRVEFEPSPTRTKEYTNWILFTTSSCPKCPSMKKAVENLPVSGEVIELDSEPDAADKYGVLSVPTLIYFDDLGKEIGRSVRPEEVK